MKSRGFCRQSSLFGTNGHWGLGMCFALLYDGRNLAMHRGGKCCCSGLILTFAEKGTNRINKTRGLAKGKQDEVVFLHPGQLSLSPLCTRVN